MDYRQFGSRLQESLGLGTRPVAIAFREEAPVGIPHVGAAAPAGCAYWRLAAEGRAFYTTAEDHMNCPIGAYTHGVTLSEAKAAELNETIGLMVGLDYLRMEEVLGIPTLKSPFHYGLYAPLDATPFDPDVVVVRGNARQIMVLSETASAACIGPTTPAMGRPACAMIPATLQAKEGVTSLGCIGNRVYTRLSDDELYFTIRAADLPTIVDKVERLVNANRELEKYHRARLAPAASASA
jgi:uncharacterized protein (DUF169 family)